MTLALLALAVGSCVFAAAILVLRPRHSWVHRRLAPHVGALPAADETPSRSRLAGWLADRSRRTDDSMLVRLLRGELERAGNDRPPEQLAWATLGIPVVAAAFGAIAGWPGPIVIVLALLAGLAPHVALRIIAVRRRRAFDAQLPELLEMLGASLRVGHGFEQALRGVAESAEEPAASEFTRVLGEIRLGRPRAEALGELGERLASRDMPFLTTAIEIQQQTGGSLAELLGVVAETVRERQQFRRKMKALTGMGRASAVVLVILPFVAATALTLVNSHYMRPLWQTSTGHLLVAVAVGMMAVGAEILRRIVSIEG